ncbi:hypothetical protein V5799_025752 [Amblyomma americanum]|uniref:Uncharacterized protein n=1 Tax=Amblyomma americanum TaxID=6943 RepID=A0AAQ4E8K1_AMBAM
MEFSEESVASGHKTDQKLLTGELSAYQNARTCCSPECPRCRTASAVLVESCVHQPAYFQQPRVDRKEVNISGGS